MSYKPDFYFKNYKETIEKMILESKYKVGDIVEYDSYHTRQKGKIKTIGLCFYFQFKDYRTDERVCWAFYGLSWDDDDFYGKCYDNNETILSNLLYKYCANIIDTNLFYEISIDIGVNEFVSPEYIICKEMDNQAKVKEVFKDRFLTKINDKELEELIKLGVSFYLTIENNQFKINIK